MYEERAEGDVAELGDGHLRLGFALEASSELDVRYGVEDRMFLVADCYVVRWCDERYLVSSSQMIPFCKAVPDPHSWTGFGRFPRRRPQSGYKALTEDDLPDGPPEIPAPYRRFLLERPVDCTIIEVGEPERFDNPHSRATFLSFRRVRVDAGARQGLLPGMRLRLRGSSRYARAGEVVYIDASSAVADFRFKLRHGTDPEPYLPRLGWSLRAGPRDG
jgi:hypothetical protein